MTLNGLPDFMKTAVKNSAFCFLFILGLFLAPARLFAQFDACGDPPLTPVLVEITDAAWDSGVDNWFGRFGVGVGMSPGLSFNISCPSGCCVEGSMNIRYFLDGIEQFCGGYTCGENMFWLPNGVHTLRKDIKLSYGNPLYTGYLERQYSFPKTFNVDNDAPVITIAQPGNNVTVTTANASVAVDVSDPLSKLCSV